MRLWLFLPALLLLALPEAQGASLSKTCRELMKGDKALTRKCINHTEFFELKKSFLDACKGFHSDVEIRMRCLRSGADLEILNLCKNAGWSLDTTLTCLRSYPTQDLMKACKRLSEKEEDQIRCLRLGREKAQMESCMEFSSNTSSRFECLEMDIPAVEARRCNNKSQDAGKRMGCLEGVVAKREREYERDQKEVEGCYLASEPVDEEWEK